MKKILFIVVMLFGFLAQAQNKTKTYSSEQIQMFIKEVFADKANELVFKSTSDRYAMITDFLQNRVAIKHVPELRGKGFKSLSEVKLENKYNSGLVRDVSYNPSTFNPLKYNVPMFPADREIYRIAETDYILIIEPVDSTIK